MELNETFLNEIVLLRQTLERIATSLEDISETLEIKFLLHEYDDEDENPGRDETECRVPDRIEYRIRYFVAPPASSEERQNPCNQCDDFADHATPYSEQHRSRNDGDDDVVENRHYLAATTPLTPIRLSLSSALSAASRFAKGPARTRVFLPPGESSGSV